MPDYIAWYLVEMRTRLAPHMSTKKVETILREAESHLRESTECLKEQLQVDEERACLAAVDAFGKPERVALTYLRETKDRVLGIRPLWFVCGCAFLALLCWEFHWLSLDGPFDNFGATWQNGLAGIIGFAALAGVFVGCRTGKRSFLKPLLLVWSGFLACSLLFVSMFVIPIGPLGSREGILRSRVTANVSGIPRATRDLDRFELFLKKGMKEYGAASSPESLAPEYRDINIAEKELGIEGNRSYRPRLMTLSGSIEVDGTFTAPSGNVFASPERGTYFGLQSIPSFASAKEEWRESGPRALNAVHFQRTEIEGLAGRLAEVSSGRLFFLNPVLNLSVVCWAVVLLPGLLLLEWAAFASIRRKRAWPVPGLA